MNEDLMQFEHSIDLACRSKFIMVDKRISDVLKAIVSSAQVYETIKRSMIGFDFSRELKIATSVEGHFAMPSDNLRAIALTFCILSAIDDKKIDINQLLAKNFTGEDPYSKFCDEVLVRFKDAVMGEVIGETIDNNSSKKVVVFDDALADRAVYLARQLEEYIKFNGRVYLDCFLKSAQMHEIQFVVVFFELVKRFTNRKGKKLISELQAIIDVIKEQ